MESAMTRYIHLVRMQDRGALPVLLLATRMIDVQRRPQSLSERDTLAARRRTHIQHRMARLDIKALGS